MSRVAGAAQAGLPILLLAGVSWLGGGGVAMGAPNRMMLLPPLSSTVTSLVTPIQPVEHLSGTLSAAAMGSTAVSQGALSGTMLQGAAPTSTLVVGAAQSGTVVAAPGVKPPVVAPKPPVAPAKPAVTVPYEELHKHASLVIMPSAFSAHYKGPTGENAEVFLAWYIGTLYNEKGLFIAPIFSLFVGADLKWAFLGEKTIRPAFAVGYYGGLGQPFTGGAVKASALAGKQAVKQAFMNDGYVVVGKHFGPVSVSAGALYGFKKAFPLFIPMLRNGSYSTTDNPPSDTLWTAFGGLDIALREQHIKVEAITLPVKPKVILPGETYVQPWLIETHVDAFLGFDLAYLKDRIGYEVIGYYLLPFYRWPDKKRLEKEAEKIERARKS